MKKLVSSEIVLPGKDAFDYNIYGYPKGLPKI
jgi:hypothetical protein